MMSRRSDVKYGGAYLMTQHWSIVLFMDMLRARLKRPSSTKYISTDIDLTTIRFSLFELVPSAICPFRAWKTAPPSTTVCPNIYIRLE